MNYKEIIELFERKCNTDNLVINQFGYGNISDINTPDDEEAPDYPYAFLNPISITQGERTAVFNANLIVMTQTYDTPEDTLLQQSNCITYLQQIISDIHLQLDTGDIQFNLPYSITPFKERFSDNVVGATASINIEYKSLLDSCQTPIRFT